MELRGYQLQTVEAVADAWSRGIMTVCVSLPTGAGKTILAAGLAARLRADTGGGRLAFVTDRLPLLPHTRQTMHAAGLRCALVQGANTAAADDLAAADVLLCSAQTLHARTILPDHLGVLAAIVDECHVDRAIIRHWLGSGTPMIGLTATPLADWMFRTDDGPAYEHLIQPMTTRQAIAAGWLLDPLFRADIPDPTETAEDIGSPTGGEGDWSEDQAESIMWPHLDAVVEAWVRLAWLPEAEGGFAGLAAPTIVQCASIDHTEALAERFNRATLGMHESGRWSEAAALAAGGWVPVTARTSQDETDRRLALFNAGRLRGLLSVAKIAIGFDSPPAAVLVSARPTRKLLPWIQLIGRIMRVPDYGFRRCTVLDCAGNGHRLAGRLHRFWTHGYQPQAAPQAQAGESVAPEPAPPVCPDHPTVIQASGAQVCRVCYRALTPPEQPQDARVWTDAVSPVDLGRSIMVLARQRLRFAPDDPHRIRNWARRQVHTLTGRWPANDWPDMTTPVDPFTLETPHPVVSRLVTSNMRSFRNWLAADQAERPESPPAVRINLVE